MEARHLGAWTLAGVGAALALGPAVARDPAAAGSMALTLAQPLLALAVLVTLAVRRPTLAFTAATFALLVGIATDIALAAPVMMRTWAGLLLLGGGLAALSAEPRPAHQR